VGRADRERSAGIGRCRPCPVCAVEEWEHVILLGVAASRTAAACTAAPSARLRRGLILSPHRCRALERGIYYSRAAFLPSKRDAVRRQSNRPGRMDSFFLYLATTECGWSVSSSLAVVGSAHRRILANATNCPRRSAVRAVRLLLLLLTKSSVRLRNDLYQLGFSFCRQATFCCLSYSDNVGG